MASPTQPAVPAGVNLADFERQMNERFEARLADERQQREAALAEERGKREATEAALEEERQARHRESCESFLNEHVNKGMPPAVVPMLRALLVNSAPRHEGTIRLSEEEGSPTYNLHAIARQLTEVIPHLPVDRTLTTTGESDTRPGTGATLDDQVIKQQARQLLVDAGIVSNNRNGVSLAGGEPASIDGED